MTEREIESERVRRERLLLHIERSVLYCTAYYTHFTPVIHVSVIHVCVCFEYRSAVGIYIRLCCREV